MKKYLSVTALAARGVVYKLLGLTLLCALLRAGEFWLRLRAELKLPEAAPNIQWLLNDSRQSLIFGICFILLYAALCTVGLHARGGHPGYTLYRLRVSERVTAVLWAAVFAAALLIFWAAQAGASLLLCRLYAARVGAEAYDNQTFFVLFYQNRLLHSLLPLDETSRWLRNFCMAAGLGLSASAFSYRQRRGKLDYPAAAWGIYAAFIFPYGTGSFVHDMLMSLIFLFAAGISLYRIWEGGCYEA
ncbi:MAG: hypothetical protein IJU78_08035 [Clostridia bacterium]|nr:hypothetical protein [Clostridia bacterium]